MKLSVGQEQLSKGLQTVGRAVAQRSPLPITSNILLETDGETGGSRLKLSATNLEIAITTWIEAGVDQPGKVTLPARLLTEFVNALPNETVTLSVKPAGHTCHVKAARFEADIKGMDAEEFPRIPTADEQPTAEIGAGLLKAMIEQVAFAAAADDTRPVLTGVQCTFRDNELTLAAADSFRLAIRSGSLGGDSGGDFSIIVPARTLTELSRILPERAGDEEVSVAITVTPNRSQVVFQAPNLHVISRLIEGAFPNVKQLVPNKFQTTVTVNTADFLKAARVASFFSRDNSNMILLDLNPQVEGAQSTNGAALTVTGAAAEVGENHGDLDAVVVGEQMHIAFNARYVADVLGVIQTPQVDLQLTGPGTAAVIRPSDPAADAGEYTHVVMPIQTAH
ncbi:MAG TPA: DNA polymerase III subunit beta [Chloroflexota bacterium]|nr:DNA polymerase III subunit beta [Chloroflexota bacterium]